MNTHTRLYLVVVTDPLHNREETRTYRASSYAEALTMAEREDAGLQDRLYGIPAEGYELAREEGITFNEADGLLLD